MVLATKSKNIKDSLFLKIISVVLAMLMCIGFVKTAYVAVKGIELFKDNVFIKEHLTVFDMSDLKSNLNDVVSEICNEANYETDLKEYEDKKNETCDLAFKRFKMAQGYFHKQSSYDVYQYSDGAEYYQEAYDDEPPLYVDQIDTVDFNVSLILSDEKAKEKIENQYNSESSGKPGCFKETLPGVKNLTYYAVGKDGTPVTNAENPEEFIANIDENDNYYYFTENSDEIKFKSLDNIEFYTYDDGSALENISEMYLSFNTAFPEDDIYKTCNDIYKANCNTDYQKHFILAIVCFLGLILLLILSCALAGHKSGNKVTAKIDRVPNDIHFIISAFLIITMGLCGFAALGNCIEAVTTPYNSYPDYNALPAYITKWLYAGIFASFCALYLFLVEWLTSICRQVRSKSGYLKNTLCFKFFGVCKNLGHKIKYALSYQPENFMARIIAIIVAYCAVSVFLFCMFGLLLGNDGYFLAFLTALLLVAITAAGWFFAIRYVILLDKIITSAHNRTTPKVNYSKLPNSLKTLVDSLSINKEELNRAVEKAVRDEHMRTELITNVSHDLKTPLTSIINYVDLLEKCDIEDETAKEYISVLDEKGSKLKRLIDDLIEASKATSGVITINAVHLNLNELATQAIVEHQQEFTNNNLDLVFKGDTKNITAYADGTKAYRIIENLLSNARKYSAKGSRVYVDVYCEDGKAVFEIKNISAEPLDITPQELTQRFVRGDKSRNKEGNGLGLSIAESFCLAMNGKLELSIDGDLFKAKVVLPS